MGYELTPTDLQEMLHGRKITGEIPPEYYRDVAGIGQKEGLVIGSRIGGREIEKSISRIKNRTDLWLHRLRNPIPIHI